MAHEGRENIRSRALVFLMALIMVHSTLTPAFAANNAGGTGGTDGTGGTGGPSSIFDAIGNDGTVGQIGDGSAADGFTTVMTQYRRIAVAITGILTITMLIFMLIQFTKLGASGDNEMARKKAIMGILTTGIATALLGGATIIIGFFWNVLSS